MSPTSEKKKCAGFPGKPGECTHGATATVLGLRMHVCEHHAKEAEAKNLRVHRHEVKS